MHFIHKPITDMQFLYVLIGPDKKALNHQFMKQSCADRNNKILQLRPETKLFSWEKIN